MEKISRKLDISHIGSDMVDDDDLLTEDDEELSDEEDIENDVKESKQQACQGCTLN